MNLLWNKSLHIGRKIRAYRVRDVYVAQEGLVFEQSRSLVNESRTYHSDREIHLALDSIEEHVNHNSVRVIEKAVLLKARGADNYGHYILEMLPRAWVAKSYLGLGNWPVLTHDVATPLSQIVIDTLKFVGFNEDNILKSSREAVFVKELVLIDGLTIHTQYMSPFVMTALDDIASKISVTDHALVYATRGPGATRDFAGEEAVRRECEQLGGSAHFTGNMSFEEQVSLFKGAASIMGVAGAALSNICFCKPGSEIYCFMPASANEVLFWMIAERRGLRYHEIRCEEVGPQLGLLPWDRKIRLPEGRLAAILSDRAI